MPHTAARVRPYGPDDLEAVYRICLETADRGEDATALFADDPRAPGYLYAAPYVTLEPELAFVLEDAQGVCGYVVGTRDSARFAVRLREEWFPRLRETLPDPTGPAESWSRAQRVWHHIHHPDPWRERYPAYPSHLHINLLPRVQGRGWGRQLIERLLGALSEAGSPGVHLGVDRHNERAQGFYRHMGFHELPETPGAAGALHMGMLLAPVAAAVAAGAEPA